ncbi:CGNR zinc finger domain-containing protein [Actinomadura luteofluorescens]|uniref:CGNR zinc finger domain-containing protein n=1 Tax=Actinomadura luteofluorescens TaxID=46163 RepID=UPI003470A23E
MSPTDAAASRHPLPPAPGDDRSLALALANTWLVTPAGTTDMIGDRELATAWLVERDLIDSELTLGDPCTARLRTLRHSIRELLTALTQKEPAPQHALTAVNDALTAVPRAQLLAWGPEQGLYRRRLHPLDQATDHVLAEVAADAADLLTGPDVPRLAACAAEPCSRFLVRTHGARLWCSVRCGDRVRAARAYARRRRPSSG